MSVSLFLLVVSKTPFFIHVFEYHVTSVAKWILNVVVDNILPDNQELPKHSLQLNSARNIHSSLSPNSNSHVHFRHCHPDLYYISVFFDRIYWCVQQEQTFLSQVTTFLVSPCLPIVCISVTRIYKINHQEGPFGLHEQRGCVLAITTEIWFFSNPFLRVEANASCKQFPFEISV